MARSTPVKKAWRSLIWLLVILGVLAGVTALGVYLPGQGGSWTPKLGLDLQGGTEIVLDPVVSKGAAAPTSDQLNQAVSIIRQRVDATGASEAQISTSGSQNITVDIPGTPDQATIDRIEASAKLEFRPVLVTGAPSTSSVGGDSTASPSPSPGSNDISQVNEKPTAKPTNASDLAYVTPALQNAYDNFDCANIDKSGAATADPKKPLVTCEDDSSAKYILGPVEVSGERVSDASAGMVTTQQGASTGQWAVNIVFDGKGTQQFADVTTRLLAFGQGNAQNQFAIVLDGRVISAPATQAAITNGKPQITGSFTQASAQALADQLKFGALPISFKVQSRDVISATLGSTQLLSGLIAGGIGLILVFGYSLFQYRTLGLVTITSLIVAAALTYLVIDVMSWRNGFRLSLAGVAGLIVAIGFTADSFIVYFERIRDELREGRPLVSAVEAGWKRALRTIFAAKGVNLLSAIVLYVLAIGNVQGFALTLGVTTVIDVAVVVLFTHPVLQLFATTTFFSSGHPLSGLDPNALGAVYRGRAQFRTPLIQSRSTGAGREAVRRQTIAERKAAELAAAEESKNKGKKS